MRIAAAGLFAAMGAVLAIAGCSAFSTSDATANANAEAGTGTAAEDLDAGGGTLTFPALGSDAGTPISAEPPTVDAGDRFCNAAGRLCADFDGHPTGEWGVLGNYVGVNEGPVELVASDTGNGMALRTTMPPGVAGTKARVMRIFLRNGVGDFAVSANVLVEKPTGAWLGQGVHILTTVFGAEADAPLVSAVLYGNGTTSSADLKLVLNAATVTGAAATNIQVDSGTLPFDTWVRLDLRGRLIGAPGTPASATLTMTARDGAILAVAQAPGIFKREVPVERTRTYAGLQRFAARTGALSTRYDEIIGTTEF